jgi:bifunctional non-homologous end joining protein LigD
VARSRKLSTYRKRRAFGVTAEPAGEEAVSASERLRFVVQKHDATRLHYDFRLEIGGVFKSWAVTRGPSLDPHDKRLAVAVEDHPLAYGDFEGNIAQGQYGAGVVMIWDRGFWAPDEGADAEAALKAGELKFTLHGQKLKGAFVLVRMRADRGGRVNWLLIKHKDKYARAGGADVLVADTSVASGRTLAAIEADTGAKPRAFMLAKPRRRR